MFTIPKNTKITAELLNDAIKYNDKKINRYNTLKDYYRGNHSIFQRLRENGGVKNNKVMVNHAKYITDTNIGYLLGNPVDYQTGTNYNIEPLLNAYKRQTINDLDTEIAKKVSIYGRQYEYVYVNENSEIKSCEIDNRNAMIIYDDSVEHNKMFGIIYRQIYKGEQFKCYEVIVCSDKEITMYETYDKMLNTKGEAKPHSFGKVPLICYKNNMEMMGDFEPVMSLIDAYNLLQSDRVNDKEQLVDAILCLYNMDFTEEQAQLLRSSRMLANIPADGKVEYLVKTLHETDVDVLRRNIENDIHKISMTPNMSDENFANNSSGVAIKYKLLSFEQNIKNKERYMEKGLMERFELYNNFLATGAKMETVPLEEVDAIFKRNLPSNDYETSQMINNLADCVDKETLISQLSFIKDASEIVALKEKEKKEDLENQPKFKLNEIPNVNDKENDNLEEKE